MRTLLKMNGDGLRYKLYLLYILNILDLIFTWILLSTRKFYEANPIMALIINNYYISFVVKCVIPGIIVWFICRKLKQINDITFLFSNIVASFGVIVYAMVSFNHLYSFVFLVNSTF